MLGRWGVPESQEPLTLAQNGRADRDRGVRVSWIGPALQVA